MVSRYDKYNYCIRCELRYKKPQRKCDVCHYKLRTKPKRHSRFLYLTWKCKNCNKILSSRLYALKRQVCDKCKAITHRINKLRQYHIRRNKLSPRYCIVCEILLSSSHSKFCSLKCTNEYYLPVRMVQLNKWKVKNNESSRVNTK